MSKEKKMLPLTAGKKPVEEMVSKKKMPDFTFFFHQSDFQTFKV